MTEALREALIEIEADAMDFPMEWRQLARDCMHNHRIAGYNECVDERAAKRAPEPVAYYDPDDIRPSKAFAFGDDSTRGDRYRVPLYLGAPQVAPEPPAPVCKYAEEIGLPPHACTDCSYDIDEIKARSAELPVPVVPAPEHPSSTLTQAAEDELIAYGLEQFNEPGISERFERALEVLHHALARPAEQDTARDALIERLIEAAIDSDASGRPDGALYSLAMEVRAAIAEGSARHD